VRVARSWAGLGNPNLITEAEIVAQRQAGVANLYELVERTRPRWLQSRGDRSINLQTTILVYQNMQALGGVDVLRDFPLANIRSLQFLDAAQAGQLPGGGGQHVEGAIVISTTG
jgi:hypothetical protein